MILQRRNFIIGAASLLAAPAIVRASSLMPVRAFIGPTRECLADLITRIEPIETPFLASIRIPANYFAPGQTLRVRYTADGVTAFPG
jgi:hypothetical protein